MAGSGYMYNTVQLINTVTKRLKVKIRYDSFVGKKYIRKYSDFLFDFDTRKYFFEKKDPFLKH
jgi:hypothetical protein